MSGGPLDDLVGPATEPVPRMPVHARVLDLQTVGGRVRVFACWDDPGGARGLFEALRARVEGSLLGELSETAHALVEEDARASAQGHAPDRGPGALQLAVYPVIPEVERAVAAFGFRPRPVDDPALRPALAALRHEWAELGIDAPLPEPPAAAFVAHVQPPSPAVDALERGLRRAGVDDVWGAEPGAPFERLAATLPRRATEGAAGDGSVPDALDPGDVRTLDHLEAALVPRAPGSVRWIPPLVFQALCDAVGVVAVRALGATIDWGLSAPDEATGLAPPPVFRIRARGGQDRYLPVGLELLRWCVMPLAPGESPPRLSEWVADAIS